MVRTLKPLAIFLLLVAPIAAFPQNSSRSSTAILQDPKSADQNPIKIREVAFTGDPVLSSAEQDEISTALSKTTYKTLQDAQDDLKAQVRDRWQQRGFFKVIAGDPEIGPETGGSSAFIATVQIDAGAEYRLANIRFLGNTVFSLDRLRSLFSMQTGDIFDVHLVREALAGMRTLYGTEGYINFTMVPTVRIDEENNEIGLLTEMFEGKQFRVGRVEILGMDYAEQGRLQIQQVLQRGSIFNDDLIKAALANARGGRKCGNGNVLSRKINDSEATVDLRFDLRLCEQIGGFGKLEHP